MIAGSCHIARLGIKSDYSDVSWLNGRWQDSLSGHFENWVADTDGKIEHVVYYLEDGERVSLAKRKFIKSGSSIALLNSVYLDDQTVVTHLLLSGLSDSMCIFKNTERRGIRSVGFYHTSHDQMEVRTSFFDDRVEQITYLRRLE